MEKVVLRPTEDGTEQDHYSVLAHMVAAVNPRPCSILSESMSMLVPNCEEVFTHNSRRGTLIQE